MAKTGPTCPICGEPTARDFRPFCSRRCADVDLARWLNGAYAIPVTDADADEDGDDVGAELAARDAPRHDSR
ncbi:MAG: DNA gyrase inhibitor YacG [Hyphomicrobiaceae bacterium]